MLICISVLSAMIAGMDDAHKYIVKEYQTPKDLDETLRTISGDRMILLCNMFVRTKRL